MTLPLTRTRRQLTPADLLPVEDYARIRSQRRRELVELKKHRQVEVGPFARFYFENFETMRSQVQEMLYIEMGGEAQLADELEAYNPLIPQGSELVATVMFEIVDPERRARMLMQLGGIEHRAFIELRMEAGVARIRGEPDPTRENTSPQGKASAVQFIRFGFTREEIAAFKTPGAHVVVGFDHPNYAHMAALPEPARATLAADFD